MKAWRGIVDFLGPQKAGCAWVEAFEAGEEDAIGEAASSGPTSNRDCWNNKLYDLAFDYDANIEDNLWYKIGEKFNHNFVQLAWRIAYYSGRLSKLISEMREIPAYSDFLPNEEVSAKNRKGYQVFFEYLARAE